MRTRKSTQRLFASTIIAGLCAVTPVTTPALGQERSLQPQSAWAVSKIDRADQGGNSYCTLSRKYDDNVVLSLGRNVAEEYSLAFDFQQPVFERDKSLKINLQPGPGQLRAYDMMPASERAVVIRLGWDTGFFDTLNSSQSMKVKIADKNYAFAMPEVAQGQKDLAKCMDELKTAAKGGAAPAPSTDVLNAEAGSTSQAFGAVKAGEGKVAALPDAKIAAAEKAQVEEQEKGVLQKFAESVRAQEASVSKEDAAPKRNFANKDDGKIVVAAAETPSEKTPAPRPPIEEPVAADTGPRAPLTKPPVPEMAKPEGIAATAPASGFTPMPEEKQPAAKIAAEKTLPKEAVSKKVTEDKPPVNAAPVDVAVNADLQKQIDVLQAEKKLLQEKMARLEAEGKRKGESEELAKITALAQEVEIKNKQLEDSLRQAQTRIAETAINTETRSVKRILDLESKLDAATKDNKTLAKQLESFKLQKEDGRLAVVAGDWDLEQATKRYNEAEREIRRLGQLLEQERTSCNREKAEIEQMLFDPAVAEQKQIQKLSQLENDLRAAQERLAAAPGAAASAAEITAAVSAKTHALESEKAALTQQVASLQKSLDEKLVAAEGASDLGKKVASLEKSLAEKDAALKDEKAALTKQVASLQKSLDEQTSVTADASALNKKVAELEKTLSNKDAEIAREKAAMAQQVASLQKALETKSSAAGETSIMTQQVAMLQKAVAEKDAALVTEKTALNAQVASLQKALDEKAASITNDKAALTQQVAALQKSLGDKEAAIAGEKAAMAQKIASLEKSLSEKSAAVSDQNALSKEVLALKQTIADKDAAMAGEKASLNQKLASLEKAVGDKNAARDAEKIALQSQLDALKTAMAQKDQQIAAFAAQPKIDPSHVEKQVAEAVGKTRAASDQEISTLKAQTLTLSQTLEKIKADADAKDKALVAARAEAQKPKQDPALLKEIADLQRGVAEQRSEASLLRDQNIVLRQETEKLKLQIADVQSNGAARADKVASVQLELDDLRRKMEMKDRQNATYQNQIATMQQETAQLKNRLTVADDNRGARNEDVEKLTRQIQTLERQLAQKDERRASVAPAAARAYDAIAPSAGTVIPASAAAVPVAAVAGDAYGAGGLSGYDLGSMKSLLQKAGVSPSGMRKAPYGFPSADNYAWTESNSVKGLASVKKMGGASFDAMVNSYIAYQKGECSGDFASMPSPTNGSAAKPMSLYEVACVGGAESQSFSLLFFEDQGRFIAVSNQISAADMDIAMDSRDRIAGFVRGL